MVGNLAYKRTSMEMEHLEKNSIVSRALSISGSVPIHSYCCLPCYSMNLFLKKAKKKAFIMQIYMDAIVQRSV